MTNLLHLHNRGTRMSTPDPAPAVVSFDAPCAHGVEVRWTQVYNKLPVAETCACVEVSTGRHGRIGGRLETDVARVDRDCNPLAGPLTPSTGRG